MAMRVFSQDEFDSELIQRKCREMPELEDEHARYWETEDGRVFQVPHPEEESNPGPGYADFILDNLIRSHGLPSAPEKH